MKQCSRCETEKALSEFAVYDGKPWCWCRPCQREASRNWAKENKERVVAGRKMQRAKFGDKIRQRNKEWRARNAERMREYNSKYPMTKEKVQRYNLNKAIKRFGITQAQYDEMYRQQNGVCAICARVNLNGRRLAIDHDHSTGQVRKLLCGGCNVGIGHFRDNPELMRKAALYIESQRAIAEITTQEAI